jgi:hypothetical protein
MLQTCVESYGLMMAFFAGLFACDVLGVPVRPVVVVFADLLFVLDLCFMQH